MYNTAGWGTSGLAWALSKVGVTNICADSKLKPPANCPHGMKEICELLDDAPQGVTNVFFADYQRVAPGSWDINLGIWRLSDCRLDKVTKYVEGRFQTPWAHRQNEGWIGVGRPRKISDWMIWKAPKSRMNTQQWQILDHHQDCNLQSIHSKEQKLMSTTAALSAFNSISQVLWILSLTQIVYNFENKCDLQ